MFKIKNLRTNNVAIMSREEFKDFIISTTHGVFENTRVLPERTGLRPESLQDLVDSLEEFRIFKGIYIVTVLGRINNNPKTRYMILIDGEHVSQDILKIFADYIPVYTVIVQNEEKIEGHASALSVWFRNTMGRGFSFIDIDYLITNNYTKVVMIEEKIGKSGISSLGYGQALSYWELVKDVIVNPIDLYFIFSFPDIGVISYYKCNINSFNKYGRLFDTTTRTTTYTNLSKSIKNFLSE